ncbi:MAG TPA: Crp/Fnr family transcriptional regulator [Cyclobacteriaceae bacterium]
MYEQLLKTVQQKVTLTSDEAELLKQFFTLKKVRKRQYMLNEGEVCKYNLFVAKGLLRAFGVEENGYEQVVQFAVEGWWISDLNSFFSGDVAVYNIEALEDCELLLLTRQSMDEMLEKLPKMERYFRLLMQNHIVALRQRIIASQRHSAEERYIRLIEGFPTILARVPQQYIASYLGMTPETLSRVRKQISEQK